jgi:hypothetical protein
MFIIYAGLDGCFVKLCTGAQILAATGRDSNNNMYPIAFAVVPKEDTANWMWFLTQLKYALGGESGEFGYYTIMSDRQKVCCAYTYLHYSLLACAYTYLHYSYICIGPS